MTQAQFKTLIASVTGLIADHPLDASLQVDLDRDFPADGPKFQALLSACRTAIDEGWMCSRDAGGIRYGRVIKPDPDHGGFSVDVVEMKDVAGPHHRHPNGEIDLVMPLTPGALFDGFPAGWVVYGPGTSHFPTVSNGSALVLYLLPQGAIEFTR